MPDYGFYNGVISPLSDIAIPLTDRSVFFADSISEVMLGYGSTIHLMDKHFTRFKSNLSSVNIPLPESPDYIKERIFDLINLSGYKQYIVYLQCSANGEYRRHSRFGEKSNLLIFVSEKRLPKLPDDMTLITYPDIRYELCNIKTTNLLPAVLASSYADTQGCAEAILHRCGRVTECAHSNIFLLKDKTLYTHPVSPYILPGIIRSRIIEIAPSVGLECREEAFTIDDIQFADEIIITSTTRLLGRGMKVDNRQIKRSKGDILLKLYKMLYEELTN